MSGKRWLALALIAVATGWASPRLQASDWRISLRKKPLVTPVQRLNRDGVQAIRKNQFKKAKELFYKAYLYDPDDPFTLNNMGYIAELEGQVERAQRFYALAAQHASEAVVDESTLRHLEGQPVQSVVKNVDDVTLQVNRTNIQAMHLLSQGRVHEADDLLEQALRQQPNNPFTLNNLGVAKEIEGESAESLKYYDAAAHARSAPAVVVTQTEAWRGRPINEMADENARRLRAVLASPENNQIRAARLNLSGVSALNRNNPDAARRDFQRAFTLDPNNAFSLNNLGYMAEMDGDWETAQTYYEKARSAYRADFRVGLATRRDAEGQKLSAVAGDNDQSAESHMEFQQQLNRRKQGPIELKRRGPAASSTPQPPPTEPR